MYALKKRTTQCGVDLENAQLFVGHRRDLSLAEVLRLEQQRSGRDLREETRDLSHFRVLNAATVFLLGDVV